MLPTGVLWTKTSYLLHNSERAHYAGAIKEEEPRCLWGSVPCGCIADCLVWWPSALIFKLNSSPLGLQLETWSKNLSTYRVGTFLFSDAFFFFSLLEIRNSFYAGCRRYKVGIVHCLCLMNPDSRADSDRFSAQHLLVDRLSHLWLHLI